MITIHPYGSPASRSGKNSPMIEHKQWIGTGVVMGAVMLSLAVWASGCGDGAVEPPPPDPPRPATVTVTPPTAELSALGATVRLSAEVRDQNGRVMAGAAVTWASSNTSVATVDASGLVTAASNGAATITATAGSASGTAAVTVAQVVSAVGVTPASDTIVAFGDTVRLVAEATDANGHAVAGAEFTWASSDTLVAVVDGGGLVTGMAAGEAEITATSAGVTGTAALAVVTPAPTTVAVRPDTVAFTAVGQTMQLAAQVHDQIGRPMEGVAVSWSSGDTLVATVDSAGLVTAAGRGTATITANAGDATGAAVVSVMQSATSVTVSPPADTIAPGDTLRLVAEAFDENGSRVADAEFVWASSDAEVVRVDETGFVTGVDDGMARVTARVGEASATSEITVVNPDRAALEALYHATGGPNWTNNENWLTDAPLNQWFGISVDPHTRRVTGIELERNNVHGSLPPAIWKITGLAYLNLAYNYQLTGSLPPEIENLIDLTYLNLVNNQFTGPIPAELGSLGLLKELVLRGNRLTGPIPPQLGNLGNLEQLSLGGNLLVGQIPPQLGNLAGLTLLNLGFNSLVGPIPTELGNLGNLWYLGLHVNQLSGEIPVALGNLSNLQRLFLSYNNLTGGVPTELGNLRNLERLGLPGNNLSGGIPTELGNLAGLTLLNLNDNDLTGSIPAGFLGLNRLERFRFDGNAVLCAPGTSAFNTWLNAIEDVRGPNCNESDQRVLERLYETSGGPNWTNSAEWRQSPVLDEWHGVTADDLGRVVTLDLTRNGLTGELRADLGSLAEMTALRLGGNALSGRLPLSLTRLALAELQYSDTGLCAPADAAFRTWLSGVASHDGTGVVCAGLSDREILEILYHATDGPNWTSSSNWLTDAPLADWYGVRTDASGRVVTLWLYQNGLSGSIPPELGNLTNLKRLGLIWSDLTGPIPPELGNLSRLESLRLDGSALSGPIPPELGNLANLWGLILSNNDLSGSIPPGLGTLEKLRELWLFDNNLRGQLPRELGNLASLRQMWLFDNDLSGLLPTELGRLSRLEDLNLSRNAFIGTIPSEYGALAALEDLSVGGNAGMSGVLPASLTALRRLETFFTSGTGLCAPLEDEFIDWLRGIPASRVRACSEHGGSVAYLTQTVQSRDFPVPLVAGEEALLRVFMTASSASGADLPPVRATFYVGGAEAHVADIAGGTRPIPAEVDESDLSKSLNAHLPAGIIQPGLEMVIEIDPDGTLDPGLGVTKRIPATGRQAVDVRTMPLLDLTLVPFLWTQDPDSAVIDAVERGARDPERDDLLSYIRTLMPVGSLAVTAHAPVRIDTNNGDELLDATEAIRVMEGGSGHYMGTMSGATTGPAGVAKLGGRSAFSRPWAQVMAHELGHNFSLLHAPCGTTDADPHYPYSDGSIGVWGYDFEAGGRLISPYEYDVMTYCGGDWISDFHFTKAFRYRLADEGQPAAAAVAATRNSLLLWGGADSTGIPYLKPAYVVDAQPALPDSTGPYRITGRTATGTELFSLAFTMPEVADGDGRSSFAFVLPTRPGWEGNLASITLSGPGGSYTLDSGSDVPMAILRDPRNGQVRAFLRDPATATQSAADAQVTGARGLEVLFSRGIPDADAWRR